VRGRGERRWLGYGQIASAALIWGSIGVIVRLLPYSAVTIVTYRVWFSLPLFFLLLLKSEGIQGFRHASHSRLLTASGVGQAAAWVAFFSAFKLTGIANAVLLLYTAPIFVALLSPYLLLERRQPRTYVSLLLATLGVALISGSDGLGESLNALGIAVGLLAGFLFALIILADRKLSGAYSSRSVVAMQLLIAAVVLAPAPFLEMGIRSLFEAGLLLMLGLVHTGLALYLYIEGLRTTLAQHAVVIQYLEPASAVIYAALLLAEIPREISLLGGLLIVAANLLLVAGNRRT